MDLARLFRFDRRVRAREPRRSLAASASTDEQRPLASPAIDEVGEIVADELRRWAASKPNRRIDLTARLAETERKLERLIDLAAATGSSTVAQRVRDLEAARSVLRAELGALKDPAPIIPSPPETWSLGKVTG